MAQSGVSVKCERWGRLVVWVSVRGWRRFLVKAMGQCQCGTRLIVIILELLQHLVYIFCVFILQNKRTSQVGGVVEWALYGCKNTEYMGAYVCYREEGPLRGCGGMGHYMDVNI